MVYHRESPNAKISPEKNTANWPPKSPYEALLSSPSGSRRWEEQRERFGRRDTSPSPRGKSVTTSAALRALAMSDQDEEQEDQDEEEEDEETLQLQLQAIEAKLKLKKLQAKKKQSSSQQNSEDASSSFDISPRKRPNISSSIPGVQVPVSPIKDRFSRPEPQNEHTSPARVLLGIDKGLKAKDVSLKRPRPSAQLQRTDTATSTSSILSQPKQSFSERIAATRLSNEQQEAKADRILQARSGGFAIPSARSTPSTNNTASQKPPMTTRDQPTDPVFRKPTNTASTLESPFVSNKSKGSTPAYALPASERFSVIDGDDEGKTTESSEDGSSFESFSALHLSRRNIPHTDLVRTLDEKELYTLPRLLRDVKAPHYDPPECESDFVVFAIIASKSTPYETKAKHQMNSSTEPDIQDEINPRNKFMVMTLTDLKWEIDLFLFDTAFTQFWKMTPGTLIAVLNPSIMPPKVNKHNGRFSLKLASSEDSVLEIGNARDLGFCESIKKDGKECGSWVNKRKTKYCDYHVELAVEKTRKNRMETNSMFRPNNAVTSNKPFKPNSRTAKDGEVNRNNSGFKSDYAGGQYFMGGKGGLSAAKLFDVEDVGKADAMRKRLAAREKERLLGEKLGKLGNGIGAEYLQARTAAISSSSSSSTADRNKRKLAGPTSTTAAIPARDPNTFCPTDELIPDALSLLTERRSAATVDLGRAKGTKRAFDSSATNSTTGTEAPMGWGGANRRVLPYPSYSHNDRPASPGKGQGILQKTNRLDREESPRKRARFELEGKGVRMPGRDSLGDVERMKGGRGGKVGTGVTRDAKGRVVVQQAPDSSDDDLDII